jgi:uncharacterized protein
LLLMGLAESGGAAKMQIWMAGGLLFVGRLIHTFGVSQAKEVLAFRVAGMAMTFAAIGSSALACIMLSWSVLKGSFGL